MMKIKKIENIESDKYYRLYLNKIDKLNLTWNINMKLIKNKSLHTCD